MHLRTASTTSAVRWALRGIRDLDGETGRDAARERAALLTTLASARHSQDRLNECEPLYRRAMEEAGFAGDEIAFARAASGLDSALFLLGRASMRRRTPSGRSRSTSGPGISRARAPS